MGVFEIIQIFFWIIRCISFQMFKYEVYQETSLQS